MPKNDTRELGQFIPLHYHFQMLYDRDRMAGFRTAIHQTVKPGAAVLELGSGTGVLSFFAAEKARKVYSVELNLDLVDQARRLLGMNKNGDRVELVHGDAFEYIPPEPVDVVICEMLHVGLLREKQLEMIDAFKSRYQRSFEGQPLPIFIPGAVVQAVQPIQHDFVFEGFFAPLIMFQHPYGIDPRTIELGRPVLYHKLFYEEPFELSCQWSGPVPIEADGNFNAIRFITKNILAIEEESEPEPSAEPKEPVIIDWYNQYLVLPLDSAISVKAGQNVNISLDYKSGDPLSALRPVVTV